MALFRLASECPLCLASASPRRQELLRGAGLPFFVYASDCAEPPPRPGEDVEAYCLRMAAVKAGSAAAALPERTIIIAADTAVECGGEILGKPRDEAEALAMLMKLSGRWHAVRTAARILAPGARPIEISELARVRLAQWPLEVLRAYVGTGKPLDKAGAYGIQDFGGFLAEEIKGSYANVLGLPMQRLLAVLLGAGLIAPI